MKHNNAIILKSTDVVQYTVDVLKVPVGDDDVAGDMLTKIPLQYLSSRSNGRLCQCGSARDSHASVTLNDYFSTAIVSHWDRSQHTSESPTDAFGEVEFAGASKRHSHVSKHFPS